MFVKNYECLDKTKYIKTNKILGEYIVTHGIPLLSRDNEGNLLFAKTKKLDEVIRNLPPEYKNMYENN